MSNIKLEKSTKECCKRKVISNIPQNMLEDTCAGVSFTLKLQAEGIKPNFSKIFKSTNFVEHLQTAAFGKCCL